MTNRGTYAALAVLGLVCATPFLGDARAQFPDRPIRVLVPNPPGGATDTTARAIGPRLSERLGQPVVVENRPGANGNIATELVARASPDGYTLLLAADAQIVISPHLYRMTIDPLKDLAVVASLGTTDLVLAVSAKLPVTTLAGFVELARKTSPPLPYASIGAGSQHHLTMELLKQRAGIELVHVPYRGGGPAMVALLGGEVQAMFGGNSAAGQIRSGAVRGLATASRKRSALFPDIPTIGETYPGFEAQAWLALFAPAGVPQPVLDRLRAETGRVLGETETAERLRSAGGIEVYPTTAEAFAAQMRREHARYGEVVKRVGVTVE
jgi:tripartite-type tricarboxylate transporter receptor subunit TctC